MAVPVIKVSLIAVTTFCPSRTARTMLAIMEAITILTFLNTRNMTSARVRSAVRGRRASLDALVKHFQATARDPKGGTVFISHGDCEADAEFVADEVRRRFGRSKADLMTQEYIDPQVAVSPQDAFYAPKESLPLRETAGRVCSEFVMCYPPGIPILAPGEMITDDVVQYILYAKEKGCSMQGTEDPAVEHLQVLANI